MAKIQSWLPGGHEAQSRDPEAASGDPPVHSHPSALSEGGAAVDFVDQVNSNPRASY